MGDIGERSVSSASKNLPSRGERDGRGWKNVSLASRLDPSRTRGVGGWKKVSLASRLAPSRGARGVIGETLGILLLTMATSEGDKGAGLRGASC